MSPWLAITTVGSIRLWRDEPAAAEVTLTCTAAELADWIDALPSSRADTQKRYRGLIAEVRGPGERATEPPRTLCVYMTVVSPNTHPGKLYTGNGKGDWIRVGDEIRLVRCDD